MGFDGDRIAYFGLSILWRAAVRSWRTFDNGTTGVTIDPTFLESIRQYLLGATGFPPNLSVVTTVASDFMSQNSCFVPAPVKDSPFTAFSLLTKGLYFRFIFGVPKLCEISIAGGGLDLIFTRDCADSSTPAFLRMMETTIVKGSLLRTA